MRKMGPRGLLQRDVQWRIIKEEKPKFTKRLRELYCLTQEDEYSLHREFSTTLIEDDEECVQRITNYVAVRKKPLDTAASTVTNIVT